MQILANKNNMIIVNNGDFIDFISYTTHIARYDKKFDLLGIDENNWNISQTTLKQLKEFINYYTSFKYTNKKEFEEELQRNKKIKLVTCFN